MEPLVAVSLAANIIQVLDFSKKLVSQSKDPRQVAGDSASYRLLINYSTTLAETRSAFSNDQTRASDTALSTLAQECEFLTAELERLLIIEEPGIGGSFRNRWKRTFHQKEFDQLAQRIEHLRSQVHLVVTTLLLEQQTQQYNALQTVLDSATDSESTRLEEKAHSINDRVNSVRQGQDTGVTDDQNLLAALVAQLNFNTEIKAAMNVKDYSTVTVLPLMWAEAPIPYLLAEDMQKNRAELAEIEEELSNLGDVFRDRFRYDVKKIWRIPDDDENAQRLLNKKLIRFVNKHGHEGSLLIILYGGHGVDTRSVKARGDDDCWWAPNTSPYGATVNWTDLQKGLELSDADCLIVMDCCFSGTTITRGQARTVNEILAASTRESPSYSGSRAYSKLLRNKFATISLPCSVQQIHDDMLSASRLKPATKTDNALLATPDHGWAGNSLRRSIRLKPLPDPNTTSPVASGDLSRAIPMDNDTRSRMFIEIEVDDSQDMSTATEEWQRWFTARLPPVTLRSLHFHTVADIHAKVMQERKAQVNRTRSQHRPAREFTERAPH